MRSDQKTGPEIRQRGFTLIETMVAIAVLSLGLLGIASMQLTAVRDNTGANRMTESGTLAQDKLEELMALPYDDPWLEEAGNPPDLDSDGNTHQEVGPAGYTIEWEVTDDTPDPNTKLIKVMVTWRKTGWFNARTGQGDQRETVLTSIRPQAW